MRISKRGQITIPKDLRERYGFLPGVEVVLVPIEDGLLLRKLEPREHPVDRVRGVLKGPLDVDAFIEDIRGR